jgi:Zn-dependent peptidase ImmA (M78 family)
MTTRVAAGQLASRLGQELLDDCIGRTWPQVDPWRLAEALGVVVFDDPNLLEDGCLRQTPTGPVVLLRMNEPIERRRFTLAHELGHVVARGEGVRSPLLGRTLDAFHSEETFCDALAGALLMPYCWVMDRFAQSPHELSTVSDLALKAGTSLSAALVRLREVHAWRRALLQWRAEGGMWVYDAEAGLWPSEQGLIKPSEDTTWALSALHSQGEDLARVSLPLLIAGEHREVEANVKFVRARALVLLDAPGG